MSRDVIGHISIVDFLLGRVDGWSVSKKAGWKAYLPTRIAVVLAGST